MMNEKHHIFLSYSHKDTEIMQRVKDKLQSETFTVWTDEGIEPGTPLWKDAIEKAIENSECVVVILTPDAKNSIWVKRELEYAEVQNKQVFPLLARGDESSSIPFAIIGTQFVDLRSDEKTGIWRIILTLKSRLNFSNQLSPINVASNRENMQLASLLIRSVQGQGSYLSLSEILAILDRAKKEIQTVNSRLVIIAKEQGFITREDITINTPTDMNEPEIIDEIIRRLRAEKIDIIEGQELVRLQVLAKASHKGFVTYDDILNWTNLTENKPDITLLDDVMDDLLEAGIEIVSANEALYQEAVEYVQQMNRASTSMLQRRFKIGYERAKAMIDLMEQKGIVGPPEGGSKPRKILQR